jgi:phage/plasmid-associated DNA primase
MASVSSASVIASNPVSAKEVQRLQEVLFTVIKSSKAGGDQNWTHNAQNLPKGKYFVTAQNLEKYYKGLCDLVAVDGMCGMMERNEPRMPIIVDNDFDFEPDPDTGNNPPIMYEDWVVTEQVKAYQETIKTYFETKGDKSQICCVFEKKGGYMKKGAVHNGFHLMFPFAVTDCQDQHDIAKVVITTLNKRGVLDKMRKKDIKPEGWEKILDPGLPEKTWVQYGCRKDSNSEAYKLTAIYDHNMQKISVAQTFDPSHLRFVTDRMIPLSFFSTHPPEYYLPVFLSIRAWDAYVPLKESIKAILPNEQQRKKAAKAKAKPLAPASATTTNERKAKMKEAQELMVMLSKVRSHSYDTWMPVGWALYTVSGGTKDGLALWITFSQQSDKFEDGYCETQWETMSAGNWTIGSLKFWAQQDSPEIYKKWRETEEGDLLVKALSQTNYDVAKFISKMYEGHYTCASLKGMLWYEFKDHHWMITDKGASLYGKISTEVVHRLDRYRTEVSKKIEDAKDDEEKERLKGRIDNISKTEKKLKDTTYKNKVMVEMSVLFFDPYFLGKLDDNPELLVCKNGVLDVKLGSLRPGVPDDFCSKTTNIEFPTHYTSNSPEVRAMEDYLSKVFPDPGVCKYIKRFSASVLRGGNPSKILPQWVGPQGNNSKSIYTDFFVQSLGQYCIKFPSTFFTGKSTNIGSCTPELARAQGARIGFIQEPDGTEKINISRAKELTGGDSVMIRMLYQEPRDIKMMMKWVIVCNKALSIPSNEPAICGRMKLVPFDAYFARKKSEVPATVEEQMAKKIFYADPFFQDKVPRLAPAFLWLMWNELPNFLKSEEEGGGLCEPEAVTLATEAYTRDSDTYAHFAGDKIEMVPGSKLTIVKLYKEFTSWHKSFFPGIQIPPRTEVRDSLNRIWKKPTSTESWLGMALRADEAEMDQAVAPMVAQEDIGAVPVVAIGSSAVKAK